MQYWPRGVRKDKIDLWIRDLGTSRELIKLWKADKMSWTDFRSRYLSELDDNGKQVLIRDLTKRAERGKITLLCACRDPETCHRGLLRQRIKIVQAK